MPDFLLSGLRAFRVTTAISLARDGVGDEQGAIYFELVHYGRSRGLLARRCLDPNCLNCKPALSDDSDKMIASQDRRCGTRTGAWISAKRLMLAAIRGRHRISIRLSPTRSSSPSRSYAVHYDRNGNVSQA